MKKERRIPSIIGVLILLVAIVGGVYLTNKTTSVQTKASGTCSPTGVQITNLTHKSVDISFMTSSTCLANIQLAGKSYGDTRFSVGNKTEVPTRTHYFQVDNLSLNTNYRFTVVSGGQNFDLPSFEFLTANKPPADIPASKLAWGKVFSSPSSPAVNAIVYLNIPGALPLSSFVTTDGNWNIPLSASFNEAKTDWFDIPHSNSEDIVIIAEDASVTQITNNTDSNNPVPDIFIGRDSFSTPTPLSQAGFTNLSQTSSQIKLSIKNPKNLESINTGMPDFFGTASPLADLTIVLKSQTTTSGQTRADSQGNWHWSPVSNLTDGNYMITVSDSTDQISTSFTVAILGSGDNSTLAFSASSSATKTLPSPTLIPSPTILPTDIPTIIPTPTEIIRVSHPSTASGTPVSGSTNTTWLIMLTSLVLFTLSFIWYSQF